MAPVMGGPGPAHPFPRLTLVLAIAAAILVIGPPARACSCAPMDLDMSLPDAEEAFVGTYVSRDRLDDQLVAITFSVERVVKGEFGPTAIVRTNAYGASCGIEFLGGPRTGLLLDLAPDGVWVSSLCQQVSPGDLLAFAPDAAPPNPGVEPIGPSSAFPWWLGAALGALLVGGVLAVAARARRRIP
jgi:hypothetical protein